MRLTGKLLLSAGLGLLTAGPAAAQDWATFKGQVVLEAGAAVPARDPLKVDKDQAACLKNGPILSEEWVVNKSNRGVANAFVWLAPAEKGAELPVHDSLKATPKGDVEVDQPCCTFTPHVLAVREGQRVVVKNSDTVAHNVNWSGTKKNEGGNVIVPAGGQHVIEALKADRLPITFACNIHPWMKGWIRIFDHPYYAVTDKDGNFTMKNAPAGKYRVIVWHEGAGWGVDGKEGKVVEVKDGEPVKLEVKPS